jgi:hypothetical protein
VKCELGVSAVLSCYADRRRYAARLQSPQSQRRNAVQRRDLNCETASRCDVQLRGCYASRGFKES